MVQSHTTTKTAREDNFTCLSRKQTIHGIQADALVMPRACVMRRANQYFNNCLLSNCKDDICNSV